MLFKDLNKNFIFLLIGQFVSIIGDRLSTVVFLSIVISIVGNLESSYQSTVLIAIQIAPFFLFGYFFGILADRVPKKSIMIFSDVGRALIVLVIYLLYDHLTVWIMYVLVFFLGTLSSMFEPSRKAIIPFLTKKENITFFNKIYAMAEIVAIMFGLIVGAFILKIISIEKALILDFFTYVVSIILLLFIRYQDSSEEVKKKKKKKGVIKEYKKNIVEGFKYIKSNDQVRYIIVNLVFFHFISAAMFFAALNDYAIRTANGVGVDAASNISLLFLIATLGALLSPLYKKIWKTTSDSDITRHIFYIGAFVLFILGIFVNFFGDSFYMILFIFVLVGFFSGIQYIRFLYLIHHNTEKKILGRVVSVAEIVWSLAIVIGILLGSFINELYTYKTGFVVCGIVYLSAALIFETIKSKVKW